MLFCDGHKMLTTTQRYGRGMGAGRVVHGATIEQCQ